MSAWTAITDHVARARALLLEQYKNKAGIDALITANVEQIQDIEDVLNDLATQRNIDDAVGIQLDRLGEIVGITRVTGVNDDTYRLQIKNRIVQNLNQATPEEVISAAKFFLGALNVWYLEVYPAELDIYAVESEIDPADVDGIRDSIDNAMPAGVSLGCLGYFNPATSFRFDTNLAFGDDGDPGTGLTFGKLY